MTHALDDFTYTLREDVKEESVSYQKTYLRIVIDMMDVKLKFQRWWDNDRIWYCKIT